MTWGSSDDDREPGYRSGYPGVYLGDEEGLLDEDFLGAALLDESFCREELWGGEDLRPVQEVLDFPADDLGSWAGGRADFAGTAQGVAAAVPLDAHSWLWRTAASFLEEMARSPRRIGTASPTAVACEALAMLATGPGSVPDLATAARSFRFGDPEAVAGYVQAALESRLDRGRQR